MYAVIIKGSDRVYVYCIVLIITETKLWIIRLCLKGKKLIGLLIFADGLYWHWGTMGNVSDIAHVGV